MKRQPAVAGRFYESGPESLREQVKEYTPESAEKVQAIAVMSPHAGLMFSGPVAGLVYSSIEMPDTFVLLGPNHTGLGASMAVMDEGAWEIPTATMEIDTPLARAIIERAPDLVPDNEAHMLEHSLEVQLPFIAHHSPGTKIVPIAIMAGRQEGLKALGEAVADAVSGSERSVVIGASTDMSHFISDEQARVKDNLALERVLALDPGGLYDTVRKEDISMCGYLPTVAMLHAALALGARSARLVKYTTSAEVSGDYDKVVGYAGVVIT
jgi:AmmeMemoRadiSam system protein B